MTAGWGAAGEASSGTVSGSAQGRLVELYGEWQLARLADANALQSEARRDGAGPRGGSAIARNRWGNVAVNKDGKGVPPGCVHVVHTAAEKTAEELVRQGTLKY